VADNFIEKWRLKVTTQRRIPFNFLGGLDRLGPFQKTETYCSCSDEDCWMFQLTGMTLMVLDRLVGLVLMLWYVSCFGRQYRKSGEQTVNWLIVALGRALVETPRLFQLTIT
jgi:hypothetical protein